VDEIAKNPDKFLQIFREKIAASARPLNDIFKAIDEDGNGLLSFKEFKGAMEETGIIFTEDVMKEVYKRFDKNESDSVSYLEFLSTIYGDSKETNVFDFIAKAEDNFLTLRKIIQANFNSWDEAVRAMKLGPDSRVNLASFKAFVLSVTDVFSRIQINDVIMFLFFSKFRFSTILIPRNQVPWNPTSSRNSTSQILEPLLMLEPLKSTAKKAQISVQHHNEVLNLMLVLKRVSIFLSVF
jgi:hypothetical protein